MTAQHPLPTVRRLHRPAGGFRGGTGRASLPAEAFGREGLQQLGPLVPAHRKYFCAPFLMPFVRRNTWTDGVMRLSPSDRLGPRNPHPAARRVRLTCPHPAQPWTARAHQKPTASPSMQAERQSAGNRHQPGWEPHRCGLGVTCSNGYASGHSYSHTRHLRSYDLCAAFLPCFRPCGHHILDPCGLAGGMSKSQTCPSPRNQRLQRMGPCAAIGSSLGQRRRHRTGFDEQKRFNGNRIRPSRRNTYPHHPVSVLNTMFACAVTKRVNSLEPCRDAARTQTGCIGRKVFTKTNTRHPRVRAIHVAKSK